MKLFLLFIITVLIQNIASSRIAEQSRQQSANNRNYKRHPQTRQRSAPVPLVFPVQTRYRQQEARRPLSAALPQRQQRQQLKQQQQLLPEVEIDTLKCPLGCVCQYARFTELSSSRWINYMQMRQPEEAAQASAAYELQQSLNQRRFGNKNSSSKTKRGKRSAFGATVPRKQAINNNDVLAAALDGQEHEEESEPLGYKMRYADDDDSETAPLTVESESIDAEESDEEGFPTNPYVKQATCILQENADPEELVNHLPHDLQVLVLLYTGIGRNKTMNISVLKTLNQLTTLEVRGSQDRTLSLVFDVPMSFLQHVNFESITLMGSNNFNPPLNPVHPSDSFDYKPKNIFLDTGEPSEASDRKLYKRTPIEDILGPGGVKLDFQLLNSAELEEFEILPYEVYKQKVKEAQMPNFYGWEHLEVLRIHGCQLNEVYWEMFDGLTALQHLSLEHNNIEMVPPFALYGALHIKTLSLAHNRIQDLHYRSLAGLLQLKWLDLSYNRLSKLSELTFPPFPKLSRIDFRHNPIKYIFPATFWVMNATREMYFDSKELALELWANTPFISLIKLTELYMGNVSVGNLEHNMLKGLAALEKLTLKGSIRSLEFDAFAGLVSLKELHLSDCQIQELSMDAFMGCRKLEMLDLSHNNISYMPPGLFDDQKILQEIYLQHNALRLLPRNFFLQSKLRVVRLNDNPWQCSCDMNNWRPKITNQERVSRKSRCVSDFQTGQEMSCRLVDDFKFDHRFAPRCANYNGRSVYYVLRKQLQCGAGRVVTNKPPRTLHSPQKTLTHKTEQQTWQARREQKLRKNKADLNRLEYVLQQQQRSMAQERQREYSLRLRQRAKTRQHTEQSSTVIAAMHEDESNDVSNDI